MNDFLKELKILLRVIGSDEDTLLKKLISNALEWIEVECNIDELDLDGEIPRGLRSIIMDMIIFRYTVLSKEGISAENIVGLSYSYHSDYPQYMLRRLKRFRRLVVK